MTVTVFSRLSPPYSSGSKFKESLAVMMLSASPCCVDKHSESSGNTDTTTWRKVGGVSEILELSSCSERDKFYNEVNGVNAAVNKIISNILS